MKLRLIRQLDKDAHHFREVTRHHEKQFFADQVVRKNLNPFRLPRIKRSDLKPTFKGRCDPALGLVSELTSTNLKVRLSINAF